ncbi:MAG: DUF2723 domain-containing protein [Candidatus Zixiibacteriota bacterium]
MDQSDHRAAWTEPVLAAICAFAVYALTAYPAITWWDSGQYSLAAVTMGITPPPGSFLLTILGWLITRLPHGLDPAHALNLLAGVLAAITVGIIGMVALRLVDSTRETGSFAVRRSRGSAAFGAALGALTFAWGVTFWEYATQFTPYILTTVFTGLIFWTMLRWWDDADQDVAWRHLLILGILFGLDFSVHRTNLLLLPGLFVWILIRRPRTLLSPRAWIAGVGGTIAGLAFHLLLIPLAASGPLLNGGDPSNWSRFYDYISLQQQGGGWLFNLFPRNAPFWSVQVMDMIRAFRETFFWTGGALGVLGLLPALFGIAGILLLWRRNRRLAVAILALMIVHRVITILYFNIPEGFFRSLHRHYLPVFVVFGVMVAYGMGVTFRAAWNALASRRWHVAALVALVFALVPASQLLRNWETIDASGMYFTEDYAVNTLNGLPENAILFTNGDNDTWPVWYMQAAHGLRPDVSVLNMPLMNTPWFVDQVVAQDAALPLSLSAEARHALNVRPWSDTTIWLTVEGSPSQYRLPDTLSLPDSIPIHTAPTIAGKYILVQDQLLLDILATNAWKRPICFAVTVSPQNMAWLAPCCRLEGLHWRFVPHSEPPVNTAVLDENLLGRYRYRGYAEAGTRLDGLTKGMSANYYVAFLTLAQAGGRLTCAQTRERMQSLLPVTRLEPPEHLLQAIENICRPDSAAMDGD